MQFSNHYSTLNVSPNATTEEIKKAFRKLALQFHPDVAKNKNDNAEKFREIQTAYNILVDSTRRQAYHYQYFYSNIKFQPQLSATALVKKAKELAAFAKALDPFRIDYEQLNNQVTELLTNQSITLLLKEGNSELIKEYILHIIYSSTLLPLEYLEAIKLNLLLIAEDNESLIEIIERHFKWQRLLNLWDKYKIIIALIIKVNKIKSFKI